MSYILTFIVGAIVGTIGGLLIYRNNASKAAGLEAKAKAAVDKLK